eukprot:CAMPEP_0205873430 /NCGR_PEP_ID=MMETSP1083-20121108/12166_1 /ASSEMBLY_ACC=CAM_ASM_000430 /TAXON_ID=97485 /ORGANISM="Prymnesium parvum, Strain Texoma1" /LENGTH=258 /DNA_ID=CAMNT_0053235935 /DNA_START=101 /DNA_END=875 /DNA_ORIENTATION=+
MDGLNRGQMNPCPGGNFERLWHAPYVRRNKRASLESLTNLESHPLPFGAQKQHTQRAEERRNDAARKKHAPVTHICTLASLALPPKPPLPRAVRLASSAHHPAEPGRVQLNEGDALEALGLELGRGGAARLAEELQPQHCEHARRLPVAREGAAVLAAALLRLLPTAHARGLPRRRAVPVGEDAALRGAAPCRLAQHPPRVEAVAPRALRGAAEAAGPRQADGVDGAAGGAVDARRARVDARRAGERVERVGARVSDG